MPEKKKKIVPPEYRMLIDRVYDETLKKNGIRFLLETTKQFTNFSYIIDVTDSVVKNEIQWKLHGLRAPTMSMPSHGEAQSERIYFNTKGTTLFSLVKKESDVVSLKIKQLKAGLKLEGKIPSWLKVYLDEKEFTERRLLDKAVPKNKPDIHRKSVALRLHKA